MRIIVVHVFPSAPYIAFSNYRCMSKLRGLVIPEKVAEVPHFVDLPEIKSRDCTLPESTPDKEQVFFFIVLLLCMYKIYNCIIYYFITMYIFYEYI